MALAGNGAVYIQQIISRETAAFLTRSDHASAAPVDLVMRSKFNPNLNSMWFTAVMEVINNVAILSIILTGSALIREREHGAIEHLLVMPVTPLEIMLSKIFANGAVIIGASLLSLLVVAHWGLGIPIQGSAPMFMISVTALGLLLATFARTMPAIRLSGAAGDYHPVLAVGRRHAAGDHAGVSPSRRPCFIVVRGSSRCGPRCL